MIELLSVLGIVACENNLGLSPLVSRRFYNLSDNMCAGWATLRFENILQIFHRPGCPINTVA